MRNFTVTTFDDVIKDTEDFADCCIYRIEKGDIRHAISVHKIKHGDDDDDSVIEVWGIDGHKPVMIFSEGGRLTIQEYFLQLHAEGWVVHACAYRPYCQDVENDTKASN